MSLPLLRWDAPGPYVAAFSTRIGGVSRSPFDTLNLGRLTHDEPVHVEENRRRLCTEAGADGARLSFNRQVHGSEVRKAQTRGEEADGLWTDERGLPLLVFTADCLPVAVARADGEPALAALHVGWRGLLAGVVERAAAALGGGTLTAIVGPGIGRCCYEVGPVVAEPFAARFGRAVLSARRLDLRAATERALRDAGAVSVDQVDLCTACRGDLFFSHRRDGGVTGRQGLLAYVA